MFQKYINNGYSFYIIDNGDGSDYVRYAILMVGKDGSKYYYDLDNEQMTQGSISDFQSHLTQGAMSFIQNLNENKQYNKNRNMKQTIKLRESELKRMIAESVRRVLNEATVDNESILQSLKNLSENKVFVELLKWGVIKLRAEHYENADIDKMFAQKIFSSIEEAADFVNSSREQTYIYVDGGEECLNIYDIA